MENPLQYLEFVLRDDHNCGLADFLFLFKGLLWLSRCRQKEAGAACHQRLYVMG